MKEWIDLRKENTIWRGGKEGIYDKRRERCNEGRGREKRKSIWARRESMGWKSMKFPKSICDSKWLVLLIETLSFLHVGCSVDTSGRINFFHIRSEPQLLMISPLHIQRINLVHYQFCLAFSQFLVSREQNRFNLCNHLQQRNSFWKKYFDSFSSSKIKK